MPSSQRFTAFLTFTAGCLLVNLLVTNGWAVPWTGAEVAFLGQLDRGETSGHLPLAVAHWLVGDSTPLFPVRLLSGLLLFGTLAALAVLMRPLFGRRTTWLGLAALAASWLLPFLGKVATADIWLFSAHALGGISLLRYLKRPHGQWAIAFYACFGLGMLILPFSSLLFFLLLPTGLYVFHPLGRALWRLQPWAIGLLLGALAYWTGWVDWRPEGMYYTFTPGPFLRDTVLGFLPFLPFVVAGVWELVRRARKREELVVIFGCWIGASLIGQSLALHLGLALLAGRQLDVYFRRAYPHRDLVRTLAVLQLLVSFFSITLLLLLSFGRYGGEGFRALMAPGAIYWMASFVVVLGLFGMRPQQVKVGAFASGLLPFLLFWLTAYPLWHGDRLWPERVARILESASAPPDRPVYILASPDRVDKLDRYLRRPLRPVTADELAAMRSDTGASVVVDTSLLATDRAGQEVTGLSDRLEPLVFRVHVPESAGEK